MDLNDIKTINALRKYRLYGFFKRVVLFRNQGFKGIIKYVRNKKKRKEAAKTQIFDIKKNDLYVIYDKEARRNEIENSNEIQKLAKENGLELKYIRCVKYYKKNFDSSVISQRDILKNFYYKTFIFYASNIDVSDAYSCISIKSAEDLVDYLKDEKNSMKIYANYCDKNNVSARTTTFFNFKGYNYYNGGAERYLVDLYDILRKHNINLNIYQEADFPFFRKYRNVNVIGISQKRKPEMHSPEYYTERCEKYEYVAAQYCQLHVYSAFFEAYPEVINPSIGISHGVAWDHENIVWQNGMYFEVEKKTMIESAKACNRLISVDTNTTNWFQTLDYEIGSKKFDLISNYVDVKDFTPRKDYLEERDKVVITYPRRLYRARGMYVLLDIAEKLIKKHKNVEIHFVGKGNDEDLNEIKKVMDKYPKNIFCYFKDPREMPDVYKMTDISVIPTMYSEGTSLSCLEAMASGNILVATRVGGLTDLVIDGYNGYLIEPNADSLFEALDDAVTNYKDRLVMKKRAIEVAESFNKDKWIKKWESVFDEFDLKKSDNVDLVEFYVADFEKVSDKVLNMMKKCLKENKLVYVRMDDEKKSNEYAKKYSGEMFQFLPTNIDTTLDDHEIYVEQAVKKNYKFKNVNII